MSDPNDQTPPEGPVTGRQTIREVMEALRVAQQKEMLEERLAERKRRREAKESRIRERREREKRRIQAAKARRQTALKSAQGKVAQHVATASRELRAALRDTMAVPMPRHSPEGREQLRIQRSIENALAALRSAGRGTFYETDIDLDLDEVGT